VTELLMIKMEDGLHPTDSDGYAALRQVPENAIVRVKFSVPRNIAQHRLFFALINVVFEHQREPHMFATREALREAITISAGYFETIQNPITGLIYTRPKSIAFGAMDGVEWRDFLEAAKRVILDAILPRVQSRDLDQAVSDILRLPGPDQIERV
jgi:uncharacterized protein DUF1367